MKNNILRIVIAVGVLCSVSFQVGAATEWSAADYDLYPGDFDGDGKTDLLYVAKDPSKVSGIARSDGTAPNISVQSWLSNHLGIPWHSNLYSVHVGYFNNDARADLFLQGNTQRDHYLLFADANGKFTGISQTIPNFHLNLTWSANQHKIHVGDFSGDGRDDLFLQATRSSGADAGSNAVVIADANGLFPANATVQPPWQDDDLGAFKWSTRNSVIHVGDFNGDGKSDLLVQGLPQITMIDFDIPIPVPVYPPGMNGVAYSQGGSAPFQLAGINIWDRRAFGADWSPRTNNVIVGDFDGNGTDDILLQSLRAGGASVLVSGNASGNVFSNAAAVPGNVSWSADGYRLIAGNFDGGRSVGLYWQAQGAGGSNYYANVIATGGAASLSTHGTVQPTAIIPPTVVGRTPGSFDVSRAGTATYRVPLWMPPAPRQLQPNLALTYDSGQGNGVLGVGWSLSGLSSIQRCNRTAGQDQNGGMVTLAASDAFCLNGERLQLTSGTPGGAASTYRLEVDDFSTVTASTERAGDGPLYFVMKDKSGITYEFGNTPDSRVAVDFFNTTPFRWKLNKVRDQYGNNYIISYYNGGGHAIPDTISWAPVTPGSSYYLYTAKFNYSANRAEEDSTITYVANYLATNNTRLESIQITSFVGGFARTVRKYALGYELSPTTKRSRLNSIQECAEDSAGCLPPTVIAYQNGQAGVNGAGMAGPGSTIKLRSAPRDYNGDGRDDLMYVVGPTWHVSFAVEGGFSSPYNTGIDSTLFPITDRFLTNGQDGLLAPLNGTWYYYAWNELTSSFSATSTGAAVASNMTSTSVALVDMTGDGRYELAWVVAKNQIYVLDNVTPAGATVPAFAATPRFAYTVTNYSGAEIQLYQGSRVSRYDFDGDGRRDLPYVAVVPCGGSCPPQIAFGILYARGQFFENTIGALMGTASAVPSVPIYFNDDTCVDRLISTTIYVQKCGTAAPVTLTLPDWPQAILDWDGDGRTDFLVNNGSTFGVVRSRGSGLSDPEPTSVPYSTDMSYFAMDQDGDGRDDVFAVNSSTSAVTFYTRTGSAAVPLYVTTWPDLASSFTDGFGVRYVPAYVSTAKDPGPSTPIGGGATVFRSPEPRVVVGQVTFSDGAGGGYNKNYSYEGGGYDRARQEYTAFSTRTEADSRNQFKRKVTYELQFPRTGLVKRDELFQVDGTTPIQVAVTQYEEHAYAYNGGNNRYLPYPKTVTLARHEVGGGTLDGKLLYTSVTTNTFDAASGALTDSVTTVTEASTGNGLQSGATHTSEIHHDALFNDFANSCFGLPSETREVRRSSIPVSGAEITRRTSVTWNGSFCRPVDSVVEPLSTEYRSTTHFEYDGFGNVSSIKTTPVDVPGRPQAARTTSIDWGTTGQFPISVTNPLSQVMTYEWNKSLGVMTGATDPNNLTTSWYPDSFGRILQESRPDGTRTEHAFAACTVNNNYCGGGASDLRMRVDYNLYDKTGASVRTDSQYSDGFERVRFDDRQLLNGSISRTAVSYNSFGGRATESVPYIVGTEPENTTYGYDKLGRIISIQRRTSVKDAAMSTVTMDYLGLRREVKDQRTSPVRTNTTITDPLGRIVQVIDAANADVDYAYDAFGNLLSVTDVDGNATALTYNQLGWKLTSDDPDMGKWSYTYFPLGEIESQKDARNNTVRFEYDGLSRLKKRTDPEADGITIFNFDTAANGMGQLASVTAPGNYSETYTYDSLGRLQHQAIEADDTTYEYRYEYNTAGMLDALTYPASTGAAPFKVHYGYQYGIMNSVRSYVSNVPGTIYWQARNNSTNARGQYNEEEFGNGLRTTTGFDHIAGWIDNRKTGSGGGTAVQNLEYEWYKTGNLELRRDLNRSLVEEFTYDSMDRLDKVSLNSVQTLDVDYTAIGNIHFKSDVGTYYYEQGTKKHAVSRTDGAVDNVYAYDANGNMLTRNGVATDWFSYNLPQRIRKSANTWSEFSYNHSRDRWKQQTSVNGAVETTTYIGQLFEKRVVGADTEYRHLIVGGNGPVAYVERTAGSTSTTSTYYVSSDHLAGTSVITSETGAVLVSESFDAFGQRRGSNWTGVPTSVEMAQIATTTRRGFTFHEHLDNLSLRSAARQIHLC